MHICLFLLNAFRNIEVIIIRSFRSIKSARYTANCAGLTRKTKTAKRKYLFKKSSQNYMHFLRVFARPTKRPRRTPFLSNGMGCSNVHHHNQTNDNSNKSWSVFRWDILWSNEWAAWKTFLLSCSEMMFASLRQGPALARYRPQQTLHFKYCDCTSTDCTIDQPHTTAITNYASVAIVYL